MKLIPVLTSVLTLIVCSWVEAAENKDVAEIGKPTPAMSTDIARMGESFPACSSSWTSSPRAWDVNQCSSSKSCFSNCCLLPEFPPPRFYTRFRGLALKRDGDGYVPFAALVVPPPNSVASVVLDSRDVDLPFEAGGELFVGCRLFSNLYLEFTYFALNKSDERAVVRDSTPNAVGGNGDLFSPFGDFGLSPLNQYDYNNYASVRYQTQLSNYELNLRKMLHMPPGRLRCSFLSGIRANQIDEDFSYRTTSDIPALAGTDNLIRTKTRNSLLGAQIGGLFEFYIDPRWWINCELEAAICQNEVTLESVYTQTSGVGGSTSHIHTHSEDDTSFVGEIVVSLVYEFSENLTTEVGYRAVWVTGLALATENLQTDTGLLILGPPSLSKDADVVYHGPHMGITLRW